MTARRARSASLVSPFGGTADNHLFWDEKTAQSACALAKIEKLQPLFLRGYLRHYRHAGIAPAVRESSC
jgi:hypothetical protein